MLFKSVFLYVRSTFSRLRLPLRSEKFSSVHKKITQPTKPQKSDSMTKSIPLIFWLSRLDDMKIVCVKNHVHINVAL